MSNTALLGSYASQAGTGLTFKNRLINGDMKISQRFGTANAAVAVSTVVYTTDRWLCYLLGAGGTASQVTASVAGHTKALKLVPSAGNTYASFVQRIESINIEDLANSVVAFSGWVYVDNATGVTATVEAYVPTAVDNYAGSTQITITNPTISITSGSYVYFEKQITLPANATNGLQVAVVFTGAASKDLRFTGASLEAGPTATPFERRPYSVELSMAMRYYQRTFNGRLTNGAFSTTNVVYYVPFIVPMRTAIAPALISGASLTNAIDKIGVGAVTPTSVTTGSININGAFVNFICPASSFIAYQPTGLNTDIIEVSAEL